MRELLRRLEVVRFARHVGPIALRDGAAAAAAGAEQRRIHSDRPMPQPAGPHPLRALRGRAAHHRALARVAGCSTPSPRATADENFSIAIPPPNVTGALHMGHALNGSIQDTLIRYHRMRGQRTKWILGTDHAGIATQKQVEKRLAGEGTTARSSAARRSSQRVWEWREQYGGTIIEQFKRLGASLRLRGRALHPRRALRRARC